MKSQMKGYIRWGPEVSWVQKLLSLWSWGMPPSGHVDTFTHSEVHQTLLFVWRCYYVDMMDYELHFQPLPLWRMEGRTENSELLIMAWSFWWPAPIWEPTKSHLIRIKDDLITQEIPRDLGAWHQTLLSLTKLWRFWSFVSGTGIRD